jgi:F0F1-type ATP synthase assembly protein I
MMAKKNRQLASLEKTTRAFQDTVRRAGPAAGASYTLVGGILLLGGLGYAFDGWASTKPWGLITGLVLGIIVGFYELVKTVWRK